MAFGGDGKFRSVHVSIKVLIFLLVLLLVPLGVSLFALFMVRRGNVNDEGVDDHTRVYQYYQENLSTKESSVGFVTISHELEEGYLSYTDSFGNDVLIHDFESDGYKCTGSCYCEGDDRRASSSVPILRGLTYFVAAVTSALAFRISETRFSEICEDEVTQFCKSHNVRAEVDLCEKTDDESSSNNDEENEVDDSGNKIKRYKCTGGCLPMYYYVKKTAYLFNQELKINRDLTPQEEDQFETLQKNANKYQCEKLKMEKEMKLQFSSEIVQKAESIEGSNKLKYLAIARMKFTAELLEQFCVRNSLHPVAIMHDDMKSFFKKNFGEKPDFPMCCGTRVFSATYIDNNPSVRCIEI